MPVRGPTLLIYTCLRCRFAISQHPKVEEKVVAELAEHGLLATKDNPNPRTLAYPDLGKLTYLQAVIKVCPSTCRGRLQLHVWHSCRTLAIEPEPVEESPR